MPSILSRPDQWLGRGRRCVTRVFLKPSVLVDLHVAVQAVLMAGPVRCASRRMSVSSTPPRWNPPVATTCRRVIGARLANPPRADNGPIDHAPPPTLTHM